MNPGMELPPRSSSRKPMPERPSKKKFRWGRFFLYLFLLAVLAAAAFAGYVYMKLDGAIGKIGEPGTGAGTISNADAKPVPAAESVKVKPVTILLMGLDTRKKTGSLNTDVMMVASFNPDTNKAVVVSIPRDTAIELEGYKRNKINQYYANFNQHGRSDKGMSADEARRYARDQMKEMMGLYFGVPVDYAAIINFQGFIDVVDALGGVDVYVDMDMRYTDHAGEEGGTDINLKKGHQHLDGDQALDFVRYRKSNDGRNMSSDLERNERQSQVLGELADKLKSLSGIAKVGHVIDAVGNNMTMDMPESEIKNMITTYFRIGKDNITFVPVEGEWRSPYVIPSDESLARAREALKANTSG